jgi:hypothetical protein
LVSFYIKPGHFRVPDYCADFNKALDSLVEVHLGLSSAFEQSAAAKQNEDGFGSRHPPSTLCGLADGAFEDAVRFVKERKAFGRAIGEFQGIRWNIADMQDDASGIGRGERLLRRQSIEIAPPAP